jgi:hypothetical protein
MGVLGSEGFARLFGADPEGILVQGLRTGAALYAVAVLWIGPPGAPRDVWGRLLGLEVGAAQALFVGIPAAWLVRPMSLAVGRPEVGAGVAALSGVLWTIGAFRIVGRRRQDLKGLIPGTAGAVGSLMILVLLLWGFWGGRSPDGALSDLRSGVSVGGWVEIGPLGIRLLALGAAILGSLGTVLFWTMFVKRLVLETGRSKERRLRRE